MAITAREFYNYIINANTTFVVPVEGAEDGATVDMTESVLTYARDKIKKLDDRKESRKNSESETQKANKAKIAEIVGAMEEDRVYTAKEIADIFELSSTQKATALMAQAVASGLVSVQNFKPTGKGRSMKGYKLNTPSDTE